MPSCEIFRTFAHGIMAVYQKQSFHKMNSNMKRFCSIYVVLEMIQTMTFLKKLHPNIGGSFESHHIFL